MLNDLYIIFCLIFFFDLFCGPLLGAPGGIASPLLPPLTTRPQVCSGKGIHFVPNFKGEVSCQKGALQHTKVHNFVPKMRIFAHKGRNLTSRPQYGEIFLDRRIFARRGYDFVQKVKERTIYSGKDINFPDKGAINIR